MPKMTIIKVVRFLLIFFNIMLLESFQSDSSLISNLNSFLIFLTSLTLS